MSAHLSVILGAVKDEFEQSDTHIPLPLMRMALQLCPLYWEAIRCLSTYDEWVDDSVVD
jgi:hypothetical protein